MLSNLIDKKVLVIGGTGSIGSAIVEQFATAGAKVFITSTSQAKLEQLLNKYNLLGGCICHLTDVVNIKDSIIMAKNLLEGIDIFVYVAGITDDALLINMKESQWRDVMQVNLDGAFHCVQQALPVMCQQKSGRMIFVSSIVGQHGNAGQANYTTSKAGLIGLSNSIALEYASLGVLSNCVCPGFIDTPMTQKLSDKRKAEIISKVPLKRMGVSADVAQAVMYLSYVNYVTGTCLDVTGGL